MRKKGQKWTFELLHRTALKYKTRGEFRKENRNAYQACQSREILEDVCSHMEGTPYVKWTNKMLHDEARKYKTRKEFRKENPKAYDTARRREILEDVCSHMEGTPYVKFTDKMLRDEARKYKTRGEFRKENPQAYNACSRRGILNKVCRYMKKPLHHKIPNCVYLIEIFTKNNELYYYVGQTSDLKNRLYRHFRYKKGSYSPVSDFLNKTPIKYKKHYIVEDNLTFKESIKLKKETIEDLKNRGIKLLNKELI